MNEYRYNVGDKVRVRPYLSVKTKYFMLSGPYAGYGYIRPNFEHRVFEGKTITIRECNKAYQIEGLPDSIMFSDDMFEPEKIRTVSFKSLL